MSLQNGIANIQAAAGPLYMQVAASLRAKIGASEWTSRAPLPNEVHLARDIGVSVGTLRKALELLEDENLIERRQGLGTFVVEATPEAELECFSNVMVDGSQVRPQRGVWSATIGDASAIKSTALNLKPGTAVYRLETLWNAANGVTAFEHVTVSAGRFPGLPQHVSDGE
jgi:GntR family transcriptional regulator